MTCIPVWQHYKEQHDSALSLTSCTGKILKRVLNASPPVQTNSTLCIWSLVLGKEEGGIIVLYKWMSGHTIPLILPHSGSNRIEKEKLHVGKAIGGLCITVCFYCLQYIYIPDLLLNKPSQKNNIWFSKALFISLFCISLAKIYM